MTPRRTVPGEWPEGLELLKAGHAGNGDIYAGRVDGVPVVVKDFRQKSAWVRFMVGRPSVRRERRAYERLQGIAGIARVFPSPDPLLLAVARIEGRALSSCPPGTVPPATFRMLGELIGLLHARGVVHLDLSHRGNILVGEDGRPWLIDLASALDFSALGAAGRWLARRLGFFDRAAAAKWKSQLCAEALSPGEAADLRWLMRLKGLWLPNRK